MLYDLGPVTLSVPDVLLDRTAYGFRDSERDASLWTERRVALPREVLDDLTRPACEFFKPHAARIELAPGTLCGVPAERTCVHVAPPNEEPIFLYLAAACEHETLVLVRYFTPTAQDAMFEHIVRSVAPVRADAEPPAPPGFARRQAGRLSVDVPAQLPMPSTFRFETDDDAVKVSVSIDDVPSTAGGPNLEKAIYVNTRTEWLDLGAPTEVTRAIAGRRAREVLWRARLLSKDGVEIEPITFRYFALDLPSGTTLRVLGVARGHGRALLDAVWLDMDRGIAPHEKRA